MHPEPPQGERGAGGNLFFAVEACDEIHYCQQAFPTPTKKSLEAITGYMAPAPSAPEPVSGGYTRRSYESNLELAGNDRSAILAPSK